MAPHWSLVGVVGARDSCEAGDRAFILHPGPQHPGIWGHMNRGFLVLRLPPSEGVCVCVCVFSGQQRRGFCFSRRCAWGWGGEAYSGGLFGAFNILLANSNLLAGGRSALSEGGLLR